MSDIEEFLNDAYYGMIDAVNLGKLSREKFDHHFNLLMKQMRAAQHRMHLTAFVAFLAGGFIGGLLMLIVLAGLYGGR